MNRTKKALAIVLAICLIFTLPMGTVFAAGDYADTAGHWAEKPIDRWSGYGVVQGNEGLFAPELLMTRAEAATIFANLLGLKTIGDVSGFADMEPGAWYEVNIAKCVAAGILTGTNLGMEPKSPLTREQMFTMLARALNIKGEARANNPAADAADISSWSESVINAMMNKGFIKGMNDGTVLPKAFITRASVMSLLDQTIGTYANAPGTVEGAKEGITLVISDDVTVTGSSDTLVVAGGDLEVRVTGDAGDINLVADNTKVILSGDVDSVVVSGEQSKVEVLAGSTVENIEITETAKGTEVTGAGKVETAEVAGDNAKIDTAGTEVKVEAGVTGTTAAGKEIAAPAEGEPPTAVVTPTSGKSGGKKNNGSTTPPHQHYYDGYSRECECGDVDPEVLRISSEQELREAITTTDAVFLEDSFALTEKVTIDKVFTIFGNNKTITGNPIDTGVHIEVAEGAVRIKDVTLENFGGDVATVDGAAVINVLKGEVAAQNLTIKNFNYAAYKATGTGATLNINYGSIICGNDEENCINKGMIAIDSSNLNIVGTKILSKPSQQVGYTAVGIEQTGVDSSSIENVEINLADANGTALYVDNSQSQNSSNTIEMNNCTFTVAPASNVIHLFESDATRARDTYSKSLVLSITGGTYVGKVWITAEHPSTPPAGKTKILIYEGRFENEIGGSTDIQKVEEANYGQLGAAPADKDIVVYWNAVLGDEETPENVLKLTKLEAMEDLEEAYMEKFTSLAYNTEGANMLESELVKGYNAIGAAGDATAVTEAKEAAITELEAVPTADEMAADNLDMAIAVLKTEADTQFLNQFRSGTAEECETYLKQIVDELISAPLSPFKSYGIVSVVEALSFTEALSGADPSAPSLLGTDGSFTGTVTLSIGEVSRTSEPLTLDIKAIEKLETPTATFTADGYDSGTLEGVENGMRYSLDGGNTYEYITASTHYITRKINPEVGIQIEDLGDGDVKVDSDPQTITVTRASAPTGITNSRPATNPTTSDGEISGVDENMEYAPGNGEGPTSDYEVCSAGGTITNLEVGYYYVRVKANGGVLASEAFKVSVDPEP